MKNLAKFYLPVLMLGMALFIFSCGEDEETPAPTNNCSPTATYPANTGTATINFVYPADTNVTVEAGKTITITANIIKGTNRPQKLRLFASGCINEKGSAVTLTGQPKVQSDGVTIDLINTDDPQPRTVIYTVPSGVNPLYLTFEVDESGGNFTRRRMKLNVSGSGIIDTQTAKVLGGNGNALPSRLSASTGVLYTVCEAASNKDFIDLTYWVTSAGDTAFICSNPARSERFGAPTTSTTCDAEDQNVGGGKRTRFAAFSGSFGSIDNTSLTNASVTATSPEWIGVAAGNLVAFRLEDGRKGVFEVSSITPGGTPATRRGGTITLNVKVQR
jgi:hypothetical protein